MFVVENIAINLTYMYIHKNIKVKSKSITYHVLVLPATCPVVNSCCVYFLFHKICKGEVWIIDQLHVISVCREGCTCLRYWTPSPPELPSCSPFSCRSWPCRGFMVSRTYNILKKILTVHARQ